MKTLSKALLILTALGITHSALGTELLNVSYDPTRELYRDYNAAFIRHWKAQTGEDLSIKSSHGGSAKQARSVIDGLQADVVTLALAGDIDALNNNRPLIDPNWAKKLPFDSTPYTSTIVFLVRKGNPKNIKDWDDLVREGVEVITANPKTSGGARWNFLAAWAYGLGTEKNETQAREFVTQLFRHVPVLDSGSRGATTSFVQRGLGDVLIAWENEAYLALKEQGGDALEIVNPSQSILAQPPVAVVDSVVDAKGTRAQATAYLAYLYSEDAQRLIAKNFYRPTNEKILAEFQAQFPPIKLVTLKDTVGSWQNVQTKFFADGALFDEIIAEINQ